MMSLTGLYCSPNAATVHVHQRAESAVQAESTGRLCCCWFASLVVRKASLRGAQEQGLETPFSKTLAMAGSLEGPETPNSVDSTVRCLHAQLLLPNLVV